MDGRFGLYLYNWLLLNRKEKDGHFSRLSKSAHMGIFAVIYPGSSVFAVILLIFFQFSEEMESPVCRGRTL